MCFKISSRKSNPKPFLEKDNGDVLRGVRRLRRRLFLFSNLYAPSTFSRPFVEGLEWNPISASDKEELVAPCTLEEIRKVVFGFDRNKSFGHDGFTMAYFLGLLG